MSSVWSNRITISIFGESHGSAIGVTIDNLPAGEYIDMPEIVKFMSRRAARNKKISTARQEPDIPTILSGVYKDRTTGTPLCAIINNTNTHSADYSSISKLARPGHADYTGALRYNGFNDNRGGGHFSGRLTAPLCFAGAVCAQILERRGIYTGAHILSIKDVRDNRYSPLGITREHLISIRNKKFPVINDEKGEKMIETICAAKDAKDSVGGIIECIATGVPAGIGSPIFNGLENSISQIMFGIPAVKGIEFGAGFDCTTLMGSENNDEFYVNGEGHVVTKTNNHGGILGGISSGMPIICNVAFKPTPSIALQQDTVDYSAMKNEHINIKGRHDPCIVPRAVPCVEAAMNIAIMSHMLDYPNF
ncbi:MAG: chorismate synthase [Oscillospiraceae bacterium]|nr:chorismate synthase [Oscillospiraceae bacterium]